MLNPTSWTINCGPLVLNNLASCSYTYLSNAENTIDLSIIDPTYVTVFQTAIDSSLYPVTFTSSVNVGGSSSTAGPAAAPANPMASSTTTSATTKASPASIQPISTVTPALGSSSKVGIGLGVPLGACALAGLALLLYRHGTHKERSRMSQMGNLAPPGGFASESDRKRLSEAGVEVQALGRQPPVYSMEMQG